MFNLISDRSSAKASEGETIIIQRNNKEVARLVSTRQINWRDKMTIKPKIMVAPEEFIKPIEDICEDMFDYAEKSLF